MVQVSLAVDCLLVHQPLDLLLPRPHRRLLDRAVHQRGPLQERVHHPGPDGRHDLGAAVGRRALGEGFRSELECLGPPLGPVRFGRKEEPHDGGVALVLFAGVHVHQLEEAAVLEKFGPCLSRRKGKGPPGGPLAVPRKVRREVSNLLLCFAANRVPRPHDLRRGHHNDGRHAVAREHREHRARSLEAGHLGVRLAGNVDGCHVLGVVLAVRFRFEVKQPAEVERLRRPEELRVLLDLHLGCFPGDLSNARHPRVVRPHSCWRHRCGRHLRPPSRWHIVQFAWRSHRDQRESC
mmetsp:Transcript_35144/g.91963  ORF Transcript_35144/g.91963 Transcript_35144/m.91963 type:complete len:293 (-) Transcript_35144:135-1013(-)